MRVLREEPSFDEAKLSKRRERPANAPVTPLAAGLGGGQSSLYSLLQLEVAAEVAAGKNGLGGMGAVMGAPGAAPADDAAAAAKDEEAGTGSDEATGGKNGARPQSSSDEGSLSGAALGGAEAAAGGAAAGGAEAGEEEAEAAAAGTEGAEGAAAGGKEGAAAGGKEAKGKEEEEEEVSNKPRTGPYASDLEYLQDMFQLVKMRSDIARVRRHMEERGQQIANAKSGNDGGEGEGEGSDDDMNAMHLESEGYYGMDEYAYEMEALSRGRFGRNMRHEASKQARHESKRARKLTQKAENLDARILTRLSQVHGHCTCCPCA